MGIRGVSVAVAALGAALLASSSASASQLLYYGGPVMPSEQVVLVEWGSQVNAQYVTQDPSFFTALASKSGTPGDLGGVLAQYGDNLGPGGALEPAANNVSYQGEHTITPMVMSTNITDAEIQTQLQSSIANSTLPAPLDNGLGTLYVILFPQADKITNGGGTSGVNFCAYHGAGGTTSSPLLYAVIPDNGGNNGDGSADLFSGGGCGSSPTALNNETSVVSHEFAEAINDPEALLYTGNSVGAPIAWYDSTSGEIADLCNAQQFTQSFSGTSWVVQKLWSNLDNGCVASESHYSVPTAGTISPLATALAGQAASFSDTGASDPMANAWSLGGGTLGPGIASYSWDWGDGTAASSGASPQHTYAQAGQYTVTVKVTDDLGFTATTSTGITVYSGIPDVTTSTPATSIADTSATLPGTINPNGVDTSYKFIYGLASNALNQSTTVTDGGSGVSIEDVSAAISNLTPGTKYYYELVGTANSTQYDGGVQNFTTTGQPPPPPAPIVSTSAASSVTGSGARLNGTVNPDGLTVTYRFAWGTSAGALTNLTSSTSGPIGTSAVPVHAPLSGLTPGRTYYFRLQATGGGKTVKGVIKSFRTLPPPPTVTLGSATAIRANSATLIGTVNPHGFAAHYYFQYGTTTRYGHNTPMLSAGTGRTAATVSAAAVGLRPKTKYHYRLVATGPGGTVRTPDRTFTTKASAAMPDLTFAVRGRPTSPRRIQIRFHCDRACSAGFAVMSKPSGAAAGVFDPIALASGQARLRHAGTGTITLRPTVVGSALGRPARGTELTIVGAAWAQPGITGRPLVRLLALR